MINVCMHLHSFNHGEAYDEVALFRHRRTPFTMPKINVKQNKKPAARPCVNMDGVLGEKSFKQM